MSSVEPTQPTRVTPVTSCLAFDVGGTFTDVIALGEAGTITSAKVPSLSSSLEPTLRDLLLPRGKGALGPEPAVLHATTLASNTLLERKGPRIGLLTTSGFRDELEFRRGARPSIYDFDWERPEALIPRSLRFEVVERISANGDVRVPFDATSARSALERLRAEGIEALAICFLNSFANSAHEQQARALAAELLPDIPVSLSSEVLPRPGEYERVSTTSVNAYLVPVILTYLASLQSLLGPAASSLRIMRSNGGLMSAATTAEAPVYMVESGPAAGVLAAASLCRELGLPRAVAFDMGGTTVKASLIEAATPEERTDYEVGGESHGGARYSHGAGFAVSVPSYDIVEAGAGGGSIARIVDGVLRVGPVSAGAEPGPAAYCKGGTEPTVTDANIVLGLINPVAIAGGALHVDRNAAVDVIRGRLGELGSDVLDVAHGIRRVANATMLRSIKAVTSERGRDPRQYVLVAYGGSGPVHAADLAEMAGIDTVYVPPLPGMFSAIGLMVADIRNDYIGPIQCLLGDPDVDGRIRSAFDALRKKARSDASHERESSLSFSYLCDLRYAGQSYDTTIDVQEALESSDMAETLAEVFQQEHEQRFGYRRPDEPIELTAVRLRASIAARSASLDQLGREWLEQAPMTTPSNRPTYWGRERGLVETPILDRTHLRSGPRPGPLIIEETTTTVVVPSGWCVRLDHHANIVIER